MRMPKCILKHFSNFCWNRGLAQACQNRGVARAWTSSLERSVKMQKVLDVENLRSMLACCSLERETQSSLERRFLRSSVRLHTQKTWALAIYAQANLPSLKQSSEQKMVARAWKPKSRISIFASQAQTKHSTVQNSTFWAHFLENTWKLILQHIL